MLSQRPYVIAFLVVFSLLAWAERGTLRALLWLLSGTLLGWLSDLSSVTTGFPFGKYVYHKEQFATELWLGPVPLFVAISLTFLSYFAFSAARRLLAFRAHGSAAAPAASVEAFDGSLRTAALAAVIGTWMDTVIDPLTLIGEYWFLGDLYHYATPGSHFGVPLSNYCGWVITVGGIVLANQTIDRLLMRGGVSPVRGPELPLEPFWGIACCAGVFLFMLSVNVILILRGMLPPSVPLDRMLLSGLLSFGLFLAFCRALTHHKGSSVEEPQGMTGGRER